MKFNEAKKAPVISSFTPMIYHSTPNKEGIPLTKTMVDMQLHTDRHSDSPKKTIEVNTETCKIVGETSDKSDFRTAVEANAENSSKNVIEEKKEVKVDDKTAVTKSKKVVEDILPKAKENVEVSKTLLCSKLEDVKVPLKTDSGSEKPSVAPLKIDATKEADIEKPSTNLETDDKAIPKPVIASKDDKSTKVENAVKTTEDNKVEAVKLEIKSPAKVPEELGIVIPTSKVEMTPSEIKRVEPAEIKSVEPAVIQNKEIFGPKPDKPIEVKGAVKVDAEKSLQGPSKLEESNMTKPSEITKQTVTNVLDDKALVEDQKEGFISNKVEEKKVEKLEQILVGKTTEPTATVKDSALLTEKQEAIFPPSKPPQTKVNLTKPIVLEAPSLSTAISRVEDAKPLHPVTKTAGRTKSPETIISLDKPKEAAVPQVKASTAPKVMKDQSELKTEDVNEKLTVEKPLPAKEIKNSQTQNKHEPNESELEKSSIDLIDLNDLGVTPPEKKERENLVKCLETDIIKLDQQLKTAQTKEADKVIKPEAVSYVTSEKPKPPEPTAPEKVKPTEMVVKAENKTNITSVMNNTDFVNQQVSKAVLIRSSASVTGHNKTIELPKITPDSKNSLTQDLSKKDITKVAIPADSKPKSINNNAPCDVPFGKWTEANKQQYLNKIRESKVSTSNTNQLKQAHDLNRRDVLKKIESQRQSNNIAAANAAKNHEIMLNHNKPSVKNETSVFINKAAVKIDPSSKIPMKTEPANKPASTKVIGPNLTITPVMRPAEAIIATSSTVTFGKKEPDSAYVAKKEFSAPNTANIAKRETNPLHYPFNLSKKDINRHSNAMKRETASTSSANLIIVAPNAPISMKRETPMPRATNLTKRDSAGFSNANITKVEIIAPPTAVAKKETMSTSNANAPIKQNAVPSGINLTKKEAPITSQTITKKETTASGTNVTQKETDKVDPKKDPNRPTNQDLIDKTIEDYLLMERKPMTMSREAREALKEKERAEKAANSKHRGHSSKSKKVSPMDDIEMQMNELHGIPFIERPPHELPYRYSSEIKTYSKTESRPKVLPMSKVNKLPNLMPLQKNQDPKLKASDAEDLSEEEIIEHEPITGDIELNIKKDSPKVMSPVSNTVTQSTSPKKVITENDFDKFVRRNSITYENCITVNYDGKKQQNVVRSVLGKDAHPKGFPSTDVSHQLLSMPQHQNKGISNSSRFVPIQADDGYNANYHSKLQIAYQSALTAKQKNSPITVIEDKPVKVVFVDNNTEFNPSQLNVQGKELSPAKKIKEPEVLALSSCDSMDSDVMDSAAGKKSQDLAKKQKHQRKQVLTPVEAPEPELIEPTDLGLEASPKKKRKTEDSAKTFTEKNYAKGVSKKTYILGRSVPDDNSKEASQTEQQRSNNVTSAIDSLVKAAELLENQSEQSNTTIDSQNSQPTPVKRGRGRPRKYPLPDGVVDRNRKVPTPQKKPRVEKKYDTSSDDSQDDEMVRENWTMGKINEDIVCPICNKLFRSENVVYKHVKHCTGPSPNRSDGGTRSRERNSQETDSKYRDESLESIDMASQTTNKTNVSKDVSETTDELILASQIKSRRISEKRDHVPTKGNETRKSLHNAKATHKTNNLVCEFCGKTFRQLSYLVSHKLQHKSDAVEKKDTIGKESSSNNKPTANVFNCEVCNKKFRKLHHLVQHRIIHNPPNMAPKLRRKSSAENSERVTAVSNSDSSKTTEDQSAAFRCEPCDKSFRKLHHLVEHRETHDGINRQKNPVAVPTSAEKVAPPPPQCDVCKKTFRKLHHLIEHKEQHADLNSEKSDDKSVKSALSTKDIIHECSLCYMVFPNEHSLMKHTVFCQRKKRQSKQSNLETEDHNSQESIDSVEVKSAEDEASKVEVEEKVPEKTDKLETEQVTSAKKTDVEVKNDEMEVKKPEKVETIKEIAPEPTEKVVEKIKEMPPAKEEPIPKAKPEIETKTTESLSKPKPLVLDTIVIEDTPKKERKKPAKNKLGSTVTKRRRTSNVTLPKLDENKPLSDEDDIRYMFNPNFKMDDNPEEKTFMRVRGLKRNSLQIERPKSSDVKRRTSLQHPPKVSRLKLKTEPISVTKTPKTEPVLSTDSDDSDTVKYSFPTTIPEAAVPKAEPKLSEKKKRRKSIVERRKSLVGIAKRKSVKTPGKSAKVLQAKTVVKKREFAFFLL